MFKFLLAVFACYAAYTLIALQVQINQKNGEKQELNAQIKAQSVQNEEIRGIIDQGVTDEYVARIAREKLDYVSAGERVFVDTAGN